MKSLAFTAALLLSGTAAAENCELPSMPELPEGATATMDHMLDGQKAVKAFQAGAQAFRDCVDEQLGALREAAAEGKEEAVERYEAVTKAYNESVSMEEKLAGAFNEAIKEFKAANP